MLLNLAPLRKHRDYRFLFTGQFVSTFGSMITYVAVPYQVYELTKSTFLVGMLSAAQLVPLVVFALWGGAYADAMDRRKLLLGSEWVMAVGSLGLVLNSYLAEPSIALIFVVSALMSAVNGFHRPALESITPRVVDKEDLPAVAALGSVRFNVSAIAGPALGGVCIAKFGIVTAYWIDVATFLVSIAAIAAMRSVPAPEAAQKPGIKSIIEGLHYARKRPELIGTYVVDIIAMLFAMPLALFPAMGTAWGGAQATGWLYSAMSVGSLALALFSGWTSKVKRHGAMVILSAALWGVAIVALGLGHSLYWAVFCLALAGAADTVSGIFRMTIWNSTIPTELRGRLAGVEMISYLSGPLLGNARAGWMASAVSVNFSIVSGGILCVIFVLACIPLLPTFWRYQSEAQEKPA